MLAKIRKSVDPYILLMAATVAFAAILPARGVGAVVAGDAANLAVGFLFFLYGARLSTKAAFDGMRDWRLHLAVLACTFALFPLLGLGVKALLPTALQPTLFAGLVFLCVLPSTVQSSIAFTSIAGGNIPAAICSASASNVIGVLLTPLMAAWLLHTQQVRLSLGEFGQILLQLIAPFVAGQLLRPLIGGWIQEQKRILSFMDRGSILLIIYVAFSKGMEAHIWSQLGLGHLFALLLILALLLAAVLAITTVVARKVMKLKVEDEIVLVFCGSKKSLASGLPMASVLFAGPQLGLVVLPLLLFHQMQLIACAGLARKYRARDEMATEPAARSAVAPQAMPALVEAEGPSA